LVVMASHFFLSDSISMRLSLFFVLLHFIAQKNMMCHMRNTSWERGSGRTTKQKQIHKFTI
jgi:hypothetical protein